MKSRLSTLSTPMTARCFPLGRFEQRRLNLSLDFYNIFNSNAIESYQQTFGPSWLSPLGIIPARFAKLGAQFDF